MNVSHHYAHTPTVRRTDSQRQSCRPQACPVAGLIYHEPLPAWNRPEMKDLQRLDPDLPKALDALLDERSVTRAGKSREASCHGRQCLSGRVTASRTSRLYAAIADHHRHRMRPELEQRDREGRQAKPHEAAAASRPGPGEDPVACHADSWRSRPPYRPELLLSAVSPLFPVQPGADACEGFTGIWPVEQSALDRLLVTPDIPSDGLPAQNFSDRHSALASPPAHPSLA